MGKSIAPASPLLAALTCAVVALQGCAESTPLWGPASPRNGANQVVDPQGGFVVPGYPNGNGGRT